MKLRISSDRNQVIKLSISGMDGNKSDVYRQFQLHSGNNEFNINLSDLNIISAGIYILTLSNDQKEIIRQKLVVRK